MTVKNVEKLEKSRAVLDVEVSAEEFEAAIEEAYRKERGNITIPGFRRGKATRRMIEKRYGEDIFYGDAVEIALPKAYDEAVKEAGLKVVAYLDTELGDVNRNGFSFRGTVAVFPEMTLGQYRGLSAPRGSAEVPEEDVERELVAMAERNARLVSVDRPAQTGDIVTIDFEGFDNGVPFEGGKSTDYELTLGSDSLIPGFEAQITGMSAGEEKDFNITFPEDYSPTLGGKEVTFHVKLSEVKFMELPELDDEFAKDVSEYDTLDELKDSIREEFQKGSERDVQTAFEDALLDKAAANAVCDIPDVLIDEQCERFLDGFKSRVLAAGMDYERYSDLFDFDEEEFLQNNRERAEQKVRRDILIGKIAEVESIKAEEADLEWGREGIAERYGVTADWVKDAIDQTTVEDFILEQKVRKLVVESATVEAPEEKTAEESIAAAQDAMTELADRTAELSTAVDAVTEALRAPGAEDAAAAVNTALEAMDAASAASEKAEALLTEAGERVEAKEQTDEMGGSAT